MYFDSCRNPHHFNSFVYLLENTEGSSENLKIFIRCSKWPSATAVRPLKLKKQGQHVP